MPTLINEKTKMFLTQLRAVAQSSSHRQLAEDLDIPVWQLRNWLYRDQPSPFVVRALFPAVNRRYCGLKSAKTKRAS